MSPEERAQMEIAAKSTTTILRIGLDEIARTGLVFAEMGLGTMIHTRGRKTPESPVSCTVILLSGRIPDDLSAQLDEFLKGMSQDLQTTPGLTSIDLNRPKPDAK
jgi:hypothetical protein